MHIYNDQNLNTWSIDFSLGGSESGQQTSPHNVSGEKLREGHCGLLFGDPTVQHSHMFTRFRRSSPSARMLRQ
jgi:hypothetical protein